MRGSAAGRSPAALLRLDGMSKSYAGSDEALAPAPAISVHLRASAVRIPVPDFQSRISYGGKGSPNAYAARGVASQRSRFTIIDTRKTPAESSTTVAPIDESQ